MHSNKQIRNVIIGTPCLDGRVDALYTYSLYESVKECAIYGINLQPIFITRESLLQKARNDLMCYAYHSDVSDMVFIDSDQYWKSSDLVRLLNHNVDCVGGTYRKKTNDEELYVAKILGTTIETEKNELAEVAGLGTGFLRLSKKAINTLFESDIPTYRGDDDRKRKMIFNVSINEDGELVGEDIHMCKLYRELGGKVFLDTEITIGHIGSSNFNGNFKEWAIKNNIIKENINGNI